LIIYLDNSATTRPSAAVMEAMRLAMTDGYFNPSALYKPAVQAEKRMDDCRALIASRLAAKGKVIFTSGGTEADNLAILGCLPRRRAGGRILYSAGEHKAVIQSCKAAAAPGFEAVEIPLLENGLVDLAALDSLLTSDTLLICVMQVNNETGAVQPLKSIAAQRDVRCPDALLHVDGVQGYLRLPCQVEQAGIDSYALSAHKFHGPKGVGALWISPRVRLQPQLHGGGQESGLRPGTHNTPGIAGMYAAIATYPAVNAMRDLKLRLYERLREAIPALEVNGPDPNSAQAADHIINISFPPVRSETLLHALEAEEVYVGNGAACTSRSGKGSHVLRAMGLSSQRVQSATRFSLNPFLCRQDIDAAANAVIQSYQLLKRYSRH
jgi:cysteine desulfurase